MTADLSGLRRPLPAQPPKPEAVGLRVLSKDEVKTQTVNFYKFGHGNGETTHWPCMDVFWTWLKKEITCITGYPNHGKSRKAHHLMLIKAALKGWKFGLYVAENEEDFYVEMAQMLVGRTANPKAGHDRMTLAQLEQALDWLLDHFIVVSAPDGATPKALLDEFGRVHDEQQRSTGKGLDGILIDPWNQLTHEFQSREDLYLSEQFSLLKRTAIKRDWAILVTAHPAGSVKDKNGKLLCPDAYSISGGKMWNNKFDNVMAVFRPAFPDPQTELIVHKIKKQGRVGKPGTLTLTYDFRQSRYFPEVGDDSHPLDKVGFNAPGAPRKDTDLPASHFDDDPSMAWDA